MAVQLFAAIDPTGTFLYACALDTVSLIPQPITGLGSAPTITVNAVGNALGAAVWSNTQKTLCFVAWQLATPLSGGETVLITASANWITTADGNLPSVSGGAVTNATGSDYPAIGNLASFTVTPSLPLGIIQTGGPAQAGFNYYPLMNWRTRLGNWNVTAGTITLGNDCAPISWTNPAATISSLIINSSVSNEVDSQGEPTQLSGTGSTPWTVMYDDPNIGTAAELQTWLSSINSGVNAGTGLDTTSRIVGVRTTSGLNTVIISYPNVQLKAGHTTRDLHLTVNHKQSSGMWSVSNYAIFPPQPAGTVLDRTAFKIDANFKTLNTSASGKTPLWYRTVSSGDTIGFGISNTVDNVDRTQPNWFSFHGPFLPGQAGYFTSDPNAVGGNPIKFIRRFNTDVTLSSGPHGNGTYSWPAVTGFICGSMPLASFQTDSASPITYSGFPLSTNMTPYSSADNGACLFSGSGYYCFEMGFTNPHGLKTGQQIFFPAPGNGAPTLSFTRTGGAPTNVGTTNIAPNIWVSSPTEIVIQWVGSIPTGTGIGALTSTTPLLPGTNFTQFIVTTSVPLNNHGSALAVEANASIAKQLNANLWLNVGFWASPACCQAMATAVQTYYPNLTLLNVETADEMMFAPAGQGQGNIGSTIIGKLIAYLPTGTKFGNYYTSTFGTTLFQGYVTCIVQNIQTEAFIAVLGESKVLRSIGCQWATAPLGRTQNVMDFVNTISSPKMPVGACTYADYDLAFNDSTIVNAFNSTANGGQNWSCSTINSWEALQCRLNSATWATIKSAYTIQQTYTGPTTVGGVAVNGLIGGKPSAVCYESAIQNYITPFAPGGVPVIPNQNPLQQDCWYTSNYAKCLRSFYQQLQTGDPNTSATNGWWASACFYGFMTSWFGSSPNWQLVTWQGQLAATSSSGNTNTSQSIQSGGVAVHQQFATPQGGSPGTGANYDLTNDSWALNQFLAWIDIANGAPAPPPPPPPPPVFPGLKIFTAVYNGFVFNGLPFDGGEGSFLPPVVLADPRQGAILPPNKDPAMVDPRQGFVIDTPTATNQVDPRQGTIIG